MTPVPGKCGECGFENPRTWRTCARCGAALGAAVIPRRDDMPEAPDDTQPGEHTMVDAVPPGPPLTDPDTAAIDIGLPETERLDSQTSQQGREPEEPLIGQVEAAEAIRTGIERAFTLGQPTLVALEGPRAAEVVKRLTSIDLTSLGELAFQGSPVAGISCTLTKRSPGGVAGAEFLAAREELPHLWQRLREEVATAGGRPAGYMALNALRLEQGIPWFGYDFGEKQIPHEAGLQHSHISYTKGCYTGQEIVERVRSRGQVNRVRVLGKFDSNEAPAAGTALMADSREAGHVTRTAWDCGQDL